MLNPNKDRLDYGQILSAPDKYKLDFAIGTSYSLDLDALVGASLSLGLSEDTDSNIIENPIGQLEALRMTGDKIALFCEGGQIHAPVRVNSLYMLLEQVVYQVKTPKKKRIGTYPSFHPKFWLIRYVGEKKNYLYRIVILSRNLTFDRSWDVSFYMDGEEKREKTEKTQPIKDFLTYLLPFAKKNPLKHKKIKEIISHLSYVHFQLNSKEFEDFDFIPVGVKKEDGALYSIKDYSLFTQTFHELLIISPFLSDEIIRDFNNRNKNIENPELVLITRAQSLPLIKAESCSKFKIYTIKDSVVYGESLISEEGSFAQKQDIHAKLFMIRKYSDSELYLGSLNASRNAVLGNVEFVIRLKAKKRYVNLKTLLTSLFCGEEDNLNNPFQRVDIANLQKGESEKTDLLSKVMKEVTRNSLRAEAVKNGEDYSLKIFFNKVVEGCDIKISPLFSSLSLNLDTEILFNGLKAVQLSEFYKITLTDGENTLARILLIPTEGLPDDREKMIISSVIKDKTSFCQYLSFLLGDRMFFGAEAVLANGEKSLARGKISNVLLPALYEKLLRTAVDDPEKFKEIDYLLKSVDKDGIVPDGFEETYQIFKKAVGYDD